MRFNEFKIVKSKVISEAKGFFGRDAGDKFTHQDGREYAIVPACHWWLAKGG